MRLYSILLAICGRAIVEMGNGYVRWANGLQICWGTVGGYTQSTGDNLSVAFTKPFKDDTYRVCLTGAGEAGLVYKYVAQLQSSGGTPKTANGFGVNRISYDGLTYLNRVEWIAIGMWK